MENNKTESEKFEIIYGSLLWGIVFSFLIQYCMGPPEESDEMKRIINQSNNSIINSEFQDADSLSTMEPDLLNSE